MTNEQPDALRLADAIQTGVEYRKTGGVHVMEINAKDAAQAADELRRQHAQIERGYAQHASVVSEYEKVVFALKDERDELLWLLKEARKIIRASASRNLAKDWDQRTTEGIAKAEGRT